MNITKDAVIQIIGSHQISADDPYGCDDQYVARSILRDLRKLVGISESAIIRFDDASGRYQLVTAKKAVARIRRNRG